MTYHMTHDQHNYQRLRAIVNLCQLRLTQNTYLWVCVNFTLLVDTVAL